VYLFIVGDGPDYARLLREAKRLEIRDRVFFFGYREDIVPFLELMDVFVLPSVGRESFGIALAEAMSMEIPVVASNIGGVGELVRDGQEGYLVEPGNALQLSTAVLDLLKDSELAVRFGVAGRARVQDHFSLALMRDRFAGLFSSLVRERPFRMVMMKFPYSSVFGGGELHTLQLASAMQERGADVFLLSSCGVLVPEFEKRGWYVRQVWGGIEVVSKVAVAFFPFLAPFVWLRLTWLLVQYRFLMKANVLYCLSLNEKMLMAPIARLLGMKVVWVEHLLIERWLIKNPFRFLYVWSSRFATVVGVSDAVRLQLSTIGVAEKHARVIYNGIDVTEFEGLQSADALGQISADAIRDDSYYPVIGTVSRLAPEKGIGYLLRASVEVIAQMPRALIVIIGDGRSREELEALVTELGIEERVLFLGFMEHREALRAMMLFDMFALTPVSGESFGIALAEAMMLEKPVVAANIGGVSEVVSDNETGIIVRAKDTQGITNALLRLAAYQEESVAMGRKGKERVLANFTLERMVDQFYDLFTE
jgi:glycosyltransferase involved in cell wall biosynthesis